MSKWEAVTDDTQRLKVKNGWLYRTIATKETPSDDDVTVTMAMCSVPELHEQAAFGTG